MNTFGGLHQPSPDLRWSSIQFGEPNNKANMHKSDDPLDARVHESLMSGYASLAKNGLLSKERLSECYAVFRKRFGPDVLKNLDGQTLLDTIHGGREKDGLGYWLEFKNDEEFPTREFGSIRGGGSLKFGVYKAKDTGEWTTGHPRGLQTVTATEAIKIALRQRDQLLAAATEMQKFPTGAENNAYQLLQNSLNKVAPDICGVAWGHKYLYLLFPEKLDDYHVEEYQRHHLRKLLLLPAAKSGLFSCAGQFVRLVNYLGWPMNHLTAVLNKRDGSPINYWRIGTKLGEGSDAQDVWPDMQEGGYAAIGWAELGDLSSLLTKEDAKQEIAEMLMKEYDSYNASIASRKAGEIRNFALEMSVKDVVLAADGTRIRGVGLVKGPYNFTPTSPEEAPHRRSVEWHDCSDWESPISEGLRTTIWKMKDNEKSLIEAERLLLESPFTQRVLPQLESELPVVLNTILYGPPGTGKTYSTIERAVRTIEKFSGDHAAHKTRFDELRNKGQIEFITLHQSYSYEDFVEGLRPVTDPEEESTEASYRYCAGVFKRIAVQALFDCLKPTSLKAGAVSFDVVWNKLIEQIELDPNKSYPGLTEKTAYCISLTPRGNLEGINTISNKKFLCPRSILEKVYAAKPEQKSISSSEVMEIVVRGCHSHFIAAVFNELKRFEKSLPASKQPPPATAFSWEQKAEVVQAFLKGRVAGAYTLKPAVDWPRYVLVIDEINRGNVSKVLGELITLIETDKRIGAEHSLIVQLPYTQDYFAVPGNLHIIGTMNTADKSIALVDVALRRRFQFEELRPNFDHCSQITPQMRNILHALNRRICLRKDRDHQIGHSYFMGVCDEGGFNRVFEKHVIPLLQEYFYNDWDGLRFVLGEKNTTGTFIKPLDGIDGANARTKWQWASDTTKETINCLQALSTNYQTS